MTVAFQEDIQELKYIIADLREEISYSQKEIQELKNTIAVLSDDVKDKMPTPRLNVLEENSANLKDIILAVIKEYDDQKLKTAEKNLQKLQNPNNIFDLFDDGYIGSIGGL